MSTFYKHFIWFRNNRRSGKRQHFSKIQWTAISVDFFFATTLEDHLANIDKEKGQTTVKILCIGTDRSKQTVQTKIRLLLKKQSDQGLHCLPLHQLLLEALMQCYIKLTNFRTFMAIVWGVPNFRIFTVPWFYNFYDAIPIMTSTSILAIMSDRKSVKLDQNFLLFCSHSLSSIAVTLYYQ